MLRNSPQTWQYDAVSVGYPGKVVRGKIISEPHNLAKGWGGRSFRLRIWATVKVMNDAAMQALGSHKTGTMLFLGLGTGLGSALVVEGTIVPMELAHLPCMEKAPTRIIWVFAALSGSERENGESTLGWPWLAYKRRSTSMRW